MVSLDTSTQIPTSCCMSVCCCPTALPDREANPNAVIAVRLTRLRRFIVISDLLLEFPRPSPLAPWANGLRQGDGGRSVQARADKHGRREYTAEVVLGCRYACEEHLDLAAELGGILR